MHVLYQGVGHGMSVALKSPGMFTSSWALALFMEVAYSNRRDPCHVSLHISSGEVFQYSSTIIHISITSIYSQYTAKPQFFFSSPNSQLQIQTSDNLQTQQVKNIAFYLDHHHSLSIHPAVISDCFLSSRPTSHHQICPLYL